MLLLFCEMQTPSEETVSPLTSARKPCCIFKMDGFSQVLLFLLPLPSSTSEIPQFRLPYDVVNFEVELMKDLGVKVKEPQPGYCSGRAWALARVTRGRAIKSGGGGSSRLSPCSGHLSVCLSEGHQPGKGRSIALIWHARP